MRRFTAGLTTEHHPLYGTFCSKLSSCIFEWDKDDIACLKEAKKSMLLKKHGGHIPTEAQILSSITSSELAKHCRRRTRGGGRNSCLDSRTAELHVGTDRHNWFAPHQSGEHDACVGGATEAFTLRPRSTRCSAYTKLGSGLQKGDKVLDVLRCGRGSSSLESSSSPPVHFYSR